MTFIIGLLIGVLVGLVIEFLNCIDHIPDAGKKELE